MPDPHADRPFDLPAELYRAVAADWPRCDEHRVWTIADHWYAAALAPTWERAGQAAAEVVAALDCAAADAFADAWDDFVGACRGLPPEILHHVTQELGRLAEGYARDVEAAKLRAWIELGRLAIDLLALSAATALALGEVPSVPTASALPAPGPSADGTAAVRRILAALTGPDVPAAVATLRHAARASSAPVTGPPGASDPTGPTDASNVADVTGSSGELDARRRDEVARHFARAAERQRDLARDAARQADEARHGARPGPVAPLDQISARAEAARADLVERARTVRPDDHPPAADAEAVDPEVHRIALQRAMPRDADGGAARRADPRTGDWFARLNGGGPGNDPTRATNTVEAVLALHETYLLGRPRVAAPGSVDGYHHGELDRQTGTDPAAYARIEADLGGLFQGLCPDVGDLDPLDARQAVDHAFTNLGNHLLNCGHGAFAVIAARTEGGQAPLWAAVNQHGTVLHLDAQCGVVTADGPAYRHVGHASTGNVVLIDALVLDGDGTYTPLPFHTTGPFGADPPSAAPSTVEAARRAVTATVGAHSPALAGILLGLLDRHAEHPGEVTATLLDPARRDATLRLFTASGTPARRPDRSTVPPLEAAGGRSTPALDRLPAVLLAEHVARVRHRVAPVVSSEVELLAERVRQRCGAPVAVTSRVRSVEALLDAVERSPAHPRIGDMVDVLDVRLLVPDPRALAVALVEARKTFGRRIGVVRGLAGPAVDLEVSWSIDERPYTCTVRLVTLRAAVAAELGREVLDRSTVAVDDMTRRAVLVTMREAMTSDVEAMLAEGPR